MDSPTDQAGQAGLTGFPIPSHRVSAAAPLLAAPSTGGQVCPLLPDPGLSRALHSSLLVVPDLLVCCSGEI